MHFSGWIRLLCLCALGGYPLLSGCTGERAVPPESGTQASAPKDPAGENSAVAASAKTPPDPLGPRSRKREIMIGGCRDKCEDHKASFFNYIRSLRGAKDGKASIPFLETSEMIFNGERRGDVWVQLFKR